MTPLFADPFYWIALADFTDTAHTYALALTSERSASPIVTTDEILTEYLTFFSTAPEQLRREVAASVQGVLEITVIRVIPQSRSAYEEHFRMKIVRLILSLFSPASWLPVVNL